MDNMKLADLKALAKRLGMRGYSRFRKSNLIDFIIDFLLLRMPPISTPRPQRIPPPRPQRRIPPPRPQRLISPPRPQRPIPPPRPQRTISPLRPLQAIAAQVQSVRFRPDRPRQPELMTGPIQQPYQLKPKRGPSTAQNEPQPPDPKKLKRKKKSWTN